MRFYVCADCGMIARADISACSKAEGGCGGTTFKEITKKENEGSPRRYLTRDGTTNNIVQAYGCGIFA